MAKYSRFYPGGMKNKPSTATPTTASYYDGIEDELIDASTDIVIKDSPQSITPTRNTPTKVQYEGLTLVNQVSGENVASLGTVNFDSVLDNIYYDSLHETTITGTGANIVVTNDSGDVADMMIFDITDLYDYLLNTLSWTAQEILDFMAVNSITYFDGMKHLDSTITSEDTVTGEVSTSTVSGKRLPNQVADTQDLQRVSDEYLLVESDITSVTTGGSFQYVRISRQADFKNPTGALSTDKRVRYANYINGSFSDGVGYIWNDTTSLGINVPLGTYASLAEAQADLAGTKLIYELATPIERTPKSINVYENGQVSSNDFLPVNLTLDSADSLSGQVEQLVEVRGIDGERLNNVESDLTSLQTQVNNISLNNTVIEGIVTATGIDYYIDDELFTTVPGANPSEFLLGDVIKPGLIDSDRDGIYKFYLSGQMEASLKIFANNDLTDANYRYQQFYQSGGTTSPGNGSLPGLVTILSALRQVKIEGTIEMVNDNGSKYLNVDTHYGVSSVGTGGLVYNGFNDVKHIVAQSNLTEIKFANATLNFVEGTRLKLVIVK